MPPRLDTQPPRAARAGPASVVVVGAGAAADAAADTLRREGYAGPVTLVGRDAEPLPMDRPNLSKDYLAGTAQAEWVPLRTPDYYRDRHIDIADDEIFVSDGSKCDCGYVLDILGDQNKVAVPDPVYPVYVDTNVMAGRSGPARKDGSYEGILYLPCTAENGFVPDPPADHADLIYLCFPNNCAGRGRSVDRSMCLDAPSDRSYRR